ncbi:conserved hypothetical protein [Nostocoides jenkinsii Ben 74]|uniref:Uncharacterized protein n=1 Tax=Nostocoides jenkinsii Ben 74 TaxID=1193518 RepID=A0A077M978_9MICO|nr:conserved hypothetical protein [Tetrasphaera jenkinsii Ben 74]
MCFVIGIVMPRMSASWKASVPIARDETCPVMATIGTESMYASAIGVTRFVAPGPEVAIQTPTRPVAAAYPCAACPAPCSWRTRMWRTFVESISGSYAGKIAPPGSPNTVSAPTDSRDRMSDCAPVTSTGEVFDTGWALWAIVAGLGVADRVDAWSVVVISIFVSLRLSCGSVRGTPTKNPSVHGWTSG